MEPENRQHWMGIGVDHCHKRHQTAPVDTLSLVINMSWTRVPQEARRKAGGDAGAGVAMATV